MIATQGTTRHRWGAPIRFQYHTERHCEFCAFGKIADRLERVRIVHGHWDRCLNNHFGGDDTAVFLDPPYRSYEKLYGAATPVADEVEAWARANAHLRIALCGHRGDYDLAGWDAIEWSRGRLTYAGGKTTDSECVWYSPPCLDSQKQPDMFIERPKPAKQEALAFK